MVNYFLYRKKINTSEDSFKHWKWAFTLLFNHSHLETGILLFVGFLESLHPQRLNELAANESRNFSPIRPLQGNFVLNHLWKFLDVDSF